jgi:hypothetical protein
MKKILLLTLILFFSFSVFAQKYGLNSPDGKLTTAIEIDNGIFVALLRGRDVVLRMGNLSLQNFYVADRNTDYKVQKVIPRSRKT